MQVADLIEGLRSDDPDEREMLILGRIIERIEHGSIDNGLESLVGEAQEYTDADETQAVAALGEYLEASPQPLAAAVWALGKADRPEAERVLYATYCAALRREQVDVAREALWALVDFESALADEALRDAMSASSGEVRAIAESLRPCA